MRRTASELEFQSKHHFPAVARGGCLAEGRIGLRAGGTPLGSSADRAELRVVEGVERLPPELQRFVFGELEGFEKREIVVVKPRQNELGVVAVVADIAASRWPREYRRVKPLIHAALIPGEDGVARLHESAAALA